MNAMDDMKKVYDTTTDLEAKKLLEPHIRETISFHLRKLVSERVRLLYIERRVSTGLVRDNDPGIDYSISQMQNVIKRSWKEALVQYRDICVMMDMPTYETPDPPINNITPPILPRPAIVTTGTVNR